MSEAKIFLIFLTCSGLIHAALLGPLNWSHSQEAKPGFFSGKRSFQVTLSAHKTKLPQKVSKQSRRANTQKIDTPTQLERKLVVEEAHSAPLLTPPPYPEESRLYGEEGLVKIKLHLNSSGRVQSFEILESSGYERLDQAVIEQMKRSTFALENGSELELSFNFELTESP